MRLLVLIVVSPCLSPFDVARGEPVEPTLRLGAVVGAPQGIAFLVEFPGNTPLRAQATVGVIASSLTGTLRGVLQTSLPARPYLFLGGGRPAWSAPEYASDRSIYWIGVGIRTAQATAETAFDLGFGWDSVTDLPIPAISISYTRRL